MQKSPVQLERLTRYKSDEREHLAIDEVLSIAGKTRKEVDAGFSRPSFPSFFIETFTEFARHVRNTANILKRGRGDTCNPEWRERIAAVVHVDGPARPQTIEWKENALYYDILNACERDTDLLSSST